MSFRSIERELLIHDCNPCRANVVGKALKDRSFVAAMWRELNQRLEKLVEKLIAAEAFAVQIIIHLNQISSFPKLHQTMNLVDERRRTPAAILAHRCAPPLIPRPQPDLAAGPFFFIRA